MKYFICFAFIAVAVVYGEKCFDKEKMKADMSGDLEECGYKEGGDRKENMKAYGCLLQKKEVVDDEGKIDCEKFKELKAPYILSNNDKIMEAVDTCCKEDKEAKAFFKCLRKSLEKECPDDKYEGQK